MKFFQTIYIYIIYLLPLIVAVLVNIWLFKKTKKITAPAWKIIAIILMLGSIGYSIYASIKGIRSDINDMTFPFGVVVVNAVIFAFTAIVITAGSPEAEEQ